MIDRFICGIDCNDCFYCTLTEEQQRKVGNKNLHMCKRYGARVLHNVAGVIKEDHPDWLFPCANCQKDNFINFTRRKDVRKAEDYGPFTEAVVEDMLTLCDGFYDEFGCAKTCGSGRSEWSYMEREDKIKWILDFAHEHAHPIMMEDY